MVTFQVPQLVGAEAETRIQAFWFHSTPVIPSFFHSNVHLSAFKVKFTVNNIYSEQHQKATCTETGLLSSAGMLFYSLFQGYLLEIFVTLLSIEAFHFPTTPSYVLSQSCLFPLRYLLCLYNYLVVCLFACYLSPPGDSRLHEGGKLTALPSAPIAVSGT